MDVILFFGFHLVIMAIFFVFGIYQFAQIEDKRKRHHAPTLRSTLMIGELDIDESELRELVREERYEDAMQRLMSVAELDQFTAKSAIEILKKQEYRPYHVRRDTDV